MGRVSRAAADLRSGDARVRQPYSNLLDYVISAALIFYILTIAGLFRLRRRDRTPSGRIARSAIRCAGAVHRWRGDDPVVLFVYRTADDVAGTGHRAAGRAGVLSRGRRSAVAHSLTRASDGRAAIA